MATCPARFEFYCGEKELRYIHNIPSSLVTLEAQAAQKDAAYVNLFVNAIQPIMKEHETACLANSNASCENCGSPRVMVLQTPTSWLHKVDDPFVIVWVNPICGKGECEIRIRQEVQNIMSEVAQNDQGRKVRGPSASMEVMPCRICGKTEEIRRCGRCRVVGYCGKEHQKEDWEIHKKVCVSKDGKSS